jgi:hypothetical protein
VVFSFALAKDIVVNTRQIEPVWSMLSTLDKQNMRRMGLDPDRQPAAYRASADGMMQLAQPGGRC